VHIARRYLLPRQLNENGLPPTAVELSDPALRRVIMEYTREAGVRNLERQLGTISRKIAARAAGVIPEPASSSGSAPAASTPTTPAVDPAPTSIPIGPAITAVGSEGETVKNVPSAVTTQAAANIPTTVVDSDSVPEYLGQPRFRQEVAFRTSRPGVATGLAWTESGGDVLFIEATLLPGGHGNLQLTGQLGNVMQESARAALSHIRSQATALGVKPEQFASNDLHVHVPAGAIPKDGPSAGVTMATAILSALRNEPVRQDVAMTGEITLSGLVLPVGGIREKSLAARRHGIKTVILPAENQIDLEDLPKEIRDEMTFVPARSLDEVLHVALPATEAAVAVE
jgi:endopeptidase La